LRQEGEARLKTLACLIDFLKTERAGRGIGPEPEIHGRRIAEARVIVD
jgi:hypothetical protein